jgi:calcineurin-like phosphoesterase family protein
LVAGTTFAVAPNLLAATRKSEADVFALLADTHIAADLTKVERTVNMAGHLQTVARELLAARRNPAGVFVVGDCAFGDGQIGDYESFLKLLDPIRTAGMTAHLALGNHDQRENFFKVINPTDSLNIGNHHVSLVRSKRANWFMLDSLEKTLQAPGLLGTEQLAWLAKSLDENSDKPALVLVHHNPGKDGASGGLKDTEDFFKVIRPRKQVKAFIYGHTHDWKVTQDESGIHLINLPPVAYVFKEEMPKGWIRATLERSGMNLELRCIVPTHPRHGEEVKLRWRK